MPSEPERGPQPVRPEERREESQPGDELAPGLRIASYRVLERLGDGGFGTVWKAAQEEPLRRFVALKVVKLGMDSPEVVARFEAERQTLALMDHPNIARVFDGGKTPRGRPWFALELVDGKAITTFCAEHEVDVDARLELFVDVCRAVQHAHQRGIVHRDLKPSNVLVAQVDGRPVPKVIDFGIAKAVGGGSARERAFTRGGGVVGTPAYMSPEQVDELLDVDTRSDVYALGALLHALLTGVPPFDFRASSWAEIVASVRDQEPERPSRRLAREPGPVPAREVRGDLDWIVLRCLEKEPARRYASVDELLADIERQRQGQAVRAGPPAASYRLRKFARRHALALGLTALVLVLLTAGTAAALVQDSRARRAEQALSSEADRALREAAKFEQIAYLLEQVLLSLDPEYALGKDTELVHAILGTAAQRLAAEGVSRAEVEARIRRLVGQSYLTFALFEEARAELERAQELAELAGEDELTRIGITEELGALEQRQGRPDRALPFFERAWEGKRRVLGAEHDETLMTLANLAVCKRDAGQVEEAEAILREVERIRIENFGPDALSTALVMNNLAGLLEAQGRREEARERLERAAAIQLAEHGEFHPTTLKAMTNLAGLYMDEGRAQEALPLLERALELKRELLPLWHPSLLTGWNNLATAYRGVGRLTEAEALYDEALEACVGVHEPAHVQVLILHLNRASVRLGQGRAAQALAEMLAAQAVARASLPADHEVLRVAASRIQEALLELPQPTLEAGSVRDHSLSGRALLALGRAEAGLDHLLEAWDRLEAGRDAEGVSAAEVAGAIGEALEALELPEEAADWRARAARDQ